MSNTTSQATQQYVLLLVIGDRNYGPHVPAELEPAGIEFLAPFKRRDTDRTRPAVLLTRWRWRIEVVAPQLVERYHLKRVWARDAWHLTSRVLRKVLSHTLCVGLCLEQGLDPLHFDGLLPHDKNVHIALLAFGLWVSGRREEVLGIIGNWRCGAAHY